MHEADDDGLIRAEGVDAFIDAVEAAPKIEPHALIIQRHGLRVFESYWAPYVPDEPRLVYSLSKTFTGSALGLAIGEGLLSLDDLVADHLPDMLEGADPITRRMRIRHIASMATGHTREMLLDASFANWDDPLRGFFTLPPEREPGSVFAYNQPPVLALATILHRLTGERLVDYLRPRLLDPIGIGHLRWMQHRPGIDLGFSGVYTTVDAVARLGQLYLDDGVCEGTRILPEGWVKDASSIQVANAENDSPDWQQGYGFQLWMSQHGYRGDGAYGQFMVVLPEQDAVIAMFSEELDMQAVLDLMWEHLLPAMPIDVPGGADGLAPHAVVNRSMPTASRRLGGVAPEPASAVLLPGEPGPTSPSTLLRVEVDGLDIVLHEEGAATRVPLTQEWTRAAHAPIAASATQLDSTHVAVDLVFVATPHKLQMVLDLAASRFEATWSTVPLQGVGVATALAEMRAPAA